MKKQSKEKHTSPSQVPFSPTPVIFQMDFASFPVDVTAESEPAAHPIQVFASLIEQQSVFSYLVIPSYYFYLRLSITITTNTTTPTTITLSCILVPVTGTELLYHQGILFLNSYFPNLRKSYLVTSNPMSPTYGNFLFLILTESEG